MNLLHDIEQYRQRAGMAETTFGRSAVGDPRLVGDLRNGRVLRPATEQRIRDFMENN